MGYQIFKLQVYNTIPLFMRKVTSYYFVANSWIVKGNCQYDSMIVKR